MNIRILLPFVAVALSICLSQGVAEAKKDVVIKLEACRANCDAKAKKCALDGVVSVQTCVISKNQCYEDVCARAAGGTSTSAESDPDAPAAR